MPFSHSPQDNDNAANTSRFRKRERETAVLTERRQEPRFACSLDVAPRAIVIKWTYFALVPIGTVIASVAGCRDREGAEFSHHTLAYQLVDFSSREQQLVNVRWCQPS